MSKGQSRRTKKAKRSAALKRAKAHPKKVAKRAAKKVAKCNAPSRTKRRATPPTVQDIAFNGEPEFVSNEPLLKL